MTTGKRLAGKVALVTGAAAGIGAAVAAIFRAEGAKVAMVDMDSQALEATAAAIRAEHDGGGVLAIQGDVAQERTAKDAVEAVMREFGALDVLVNNAAMRNYAALSEASAEDWRAMVGVNLMGTASFCRAALPHLRTGGRASIVNVSSCYAVTGRKGMGLYDATKAGMLAMTRTLAHEEAAHAVRVNAVCPGSTLTDFHVKRARAGGRSVETLKTERSTTSLLGRWAEPSEIAYPILWLASDEASFITGTTLLVDGGLHVM